MLGEVEQKIIGCFRTGGGLPYSEYPRFHTLMAEMSGEVFDAALVDVILPMADGLPGTLARGRGRRRYRLRQWACHQRDGAGVPGQPVHRHRLLRRGPGRRTRRGRPARPDERDVRRRRRRRPRRGRSLRRDHRFRRDPRPGPPGAGAGQHPPRAAAGRVSSDGRHQGVEPPRGQRRRPARVRTCTRSRRCTA